MRSFAFAITSLLLAGSAAAREAHVYLSDHAIRDSSALSPETARLVFAQRLGLGQSQSIKQVDENTIEALNAFGGRPQKLFGQDDAHRQRALIMVEGVKDVKGRQE
jgi:phage-related baseplate assembly protein